MLPFDRSELSKYLLEVLYHDGIDLNTEFKDRAAICYLFGALDQVGEALIPTWGVKMVPTLAGITAAIGCELFLALPLPCQFLPLA
jgi:hypothetical protein